MSTERNAATGKDGQRGRHPSTPSGRRNSGRREWSDSNSFVEAMKLYMDEHGIAPKDLTPMIGSRSRVSEVLSGNRAITISMARALHTHLGIPADLLLKEAVVRTRASEADVDWRRFPLGQMATRGWIQRKGNLRQNAEELVFGLQKKAGLQGKPFVFYRKNDHNRANAKANPYALTAWCWQVLAQANQRNQKVRFGKIKDRPGFLKQIARLSSTPNGPRRAVDVLADHGIAVEIVHHLPGTYLDGAAMRSSNGNPVIGMTLRYDRIDNFWFVLLHELAHVTHHLDDSSTAFIDDLKLEGTNSQESHADDLTVQALVPDSAWDASGIADNPTTMAVLDLAQQLGIHPAIVAGRVRYKLGNYRLLSQFVGTGEVRPMFVSKVGQ